VRHREREVRVGEPLTEEEDTKLGAPEGLEETDVIEPAPRAVSRNQCDGVSLPSEDFGYILSRATER
jgi:hypothetical protein